MFYKHLIVKGNNGDSLYLYIDFNYELSRDFNSKNKKERSKSIYRKVIDYIKDNKINFSTGKVFLVINGLIIASLVLRNPQYSNLKDTLEPQYQYVEHSDVFDNSKNNDSLFTPSTTESTSNNSSTNEQSNDNQTVKSVVESQIVTQTPSTTKSPAATTPSKSSASTSTTQSATTAVTTPTPTTSQEVTTTPSNPTPTTPVAPSPAPEPAEQMVTLYRSTGTVDQISLEDYVIGVVGAEMPASFNVEALKAQSVLARTYALKKIEKNQVLKDDTSNQVYKDNNQLKALWGTDFTTYYNKIKDCVNLTKGQYLSYNGDYIEAIYHSTSNGQTEDSVVVWGNDYPYLKSVDSHWDLNASSYLRETAMDLNVISTALGIDFNSQTSIQVISRTASNRIDKIQIGGTTFTGIDVRTLLGLRSTDFDIKFENNQAVFVTRGYGHGVGMSQYGANGMAKEGSSYKIILAHYYPGTQLKS